MAVVAVLTSHLVDDGVHRSWLRAKYVTALERHAGVGVVLLPTMVSPRGTLETLGRVDGVLLTGDESNIDRHALLGGRHAAAARAPKWRAGVLDHHRDRLARHVLDGAFGLGLPLLGICRGLQEMNVYFGGTLHAKLSAQSRFGDTHHEDLSLPRDEQYRPVHAITLQPGGRLREWLRGAPSAGDRLDVNSLHHQGIDALAAALRAEAVADDGLVEAASVRDAPTFQLGVQWHPEWHAASEPVGQRLFGRFGAACRRFERRRRGRGARTAATAVTA